MSRWARLLSRRHRMMEDLDQDIRDYIEREIQDNIERGMSPVVVGWAAGIIAAIVAGGVVRSLLFDVTAQDPLTIATVTLVVLSSAALACYIPARRATKVNPMVALRNE